MAIPGKKKKCPSEGAADWLLTYGDMTTLLLTFFVMLFTTATLDEAKLKLILSAFQGLGMYSSGVTLERTTGKLADLGNTIESLPSMERGKALSTAYERAISEFQPEIKTKKVRVTEDERGLVISLAADSFFRPASATIDIEETRELLQRISMLLMSLPDKRFRIEGHTDTTPTDPDGPWPTNWELSSARAINTLKYLTDFGVSDRNFQVAGFADTVPLANEDTPEGRAYNRRIDIIILTEGHL